MTETPKPDDAHNASLGLKRLLCASSIYRSGANHLDIADASRQLIHQGEAFTKLADLHTNYDSNYDGIEIEIGTRSDRLAANLEEEVWVTLQVILPWKDVERLRDALTFMLSLA